VSICILPKKITIKLVWLCLKTFYQQKTFAFTIKDTQSSAAKHKNGKHDFLYRINVASSFHKAIKPIRKKFSKKLRCELYKTQATPT
jgi:hypothetical protein